MSRAVKETRKPVEGDIGDGGSEFAWPDGWIKFSKPIVVILAGAFLASCSLPGLQPGQPVDPAALQKNMASINYLLQATGCPIATAAAAASPVVSIEGDDKGNQVLKAIGASGGLLCTVSVPPTALPAPVPANAAPVSLAVPKAS